MGSLVLLIFLSRLVVHKDFEIPASKLLNGALNFVLEFKNKDKEANTTFPSWVTSDGKKNEHSRLGLVLWRFGGWHHFMERRGSITK